MMIMCLLARRFVKEEADKFVKNYLTGEDGQMYKEATAKNYEQILSGKSGLGQEVAG